MAGGTDLAVSYKMAIDWLFKNNPDDDYEAIDKQNKQYPPSGSDSYSQDLSATLTNGDQMWRDRRFVTSSTTTDDLDLAGGLTNVFGETITLATIRLILIHNRSITAGDDLDIGGAAANPLTSIHDGSGTAKFTVRASGICVLSAPLDGYAVTGGSADTLRVTHAGASEAITYDIVIVGVE